MIYDVYLDDVLFYGVEKVNFPEDRKITVYNGIGTGYFPKADDPNLKEWSWECQLQEFPEHYHGSGFLPASQIKARLTEMLKSKEPVRLIIKSNYTSISEEVLLESRNFNEVYAGVYSVTIKVTEYVRASIRVTDIPEIERPGKIPEVPTVTVTDDNDNTLYDEGNSAPDSFIGPPTFEDWQTEHEGEFVNPVDPPINEPVKPENRPIDEIQAEIGKQNREDLYQSIGGFFTETIPNRWSEFVSKADDAFSEIQKGYDDFAEKMGWR